MRTLVIAIGLGALVSGSSAVQVVKPLDRLIENNITIPVPLPSCGAPRLVRALGRQLGLPVGVEFMPGSCQGLATNVDPGDDVPLIALSLREALDRIVAVDPRYAWRESDGVIVMRPLEAWANRDHYLHRTFAFGFTDRTYHWAVGEVFTGLGKPGSAFADLQGRTAGGARTLSVATAIRSGVEALDAMVRAHGALEWNVRYCEPRVDPEVAWLGVFTYDDDGLVAPVVQRRDESGKPLPPRCRLGQ